MQNSVGWALGFAVTVVSTGCVGALGDEGPCTSAGQCLPGYECVENYCLRCEEGGCGGLVVLSASPAGGRFCGPDDACIEIPARGLLATVDLTFRRVHVAVPSNFEVRSIAYEVGPRDLVFSTPALVTLPISPSDPVSNIRVHRTNAPEGPWTMLTSTATATNVSASTSQLGFFVAARVPEPL